MTSIFPHVASEMDCDEAEFVLVFTIFTMSLVAIDAPSRPHNPIFYVTSSRGQYGDADLRTLSSDLASRSTMFTKYQAHIPTTTC